MRMKNKISKNKQRTTACLSECIKSASLSSTVMHAPRPFLQNPPRQTFILFPLFPDHKRGWQSQLWLSPGVLRGGDEPGGVHSYADSAHNAQRRCILFPPPFHPGL